MTETVNSSKYIICQVCSNAILLTDDLQKTLICDRCGEVETRLKPKSASRTLAFALTALILYFPANIFPFMTIELYGNKNSSTIWSGIVTMYETGSWPIALVIFFASMVIPFGKMIFLIYLVLAARLGRHPLILTRFFRAVESLGRWSMLDIFLLAVLVAIMKLGPWTSVRPEIGSLLFTLVVIFTTLASASFEPSLLWEEFSAKPINPKN